jgi:TnpA family transposase
MKSAPSARELADVYTPNFVELVWAEKRTRESALGSSGIALGLGKHASADGTKWDLHAQNLMSEYHLRYGGYGGIGYYLVSDMYIALFSRFTTCGSWEGHNILDYLVENDSDVRPDTIHADTQGQSAAIFGLAYLPGVQLQPRWP